MITKTHSEKPSKSIPGERYVEIEFFNKFRPEIKYHTYLNPNNHNFKKWKNLIVGNIVDGLELKIGEEDLIDADSIPRVIAHKELPKTQGELFK
jgi:hypothetical protein